MDVCRTAILLAYETVSDFGVLGVYVSTRDFFLLIVGGRFRQGLIIGVVCGQLGYRVGGVLCGYVCFFVQPAVVRDLASSVGYVLIVCGVRVVVLYLCVTNFVC